MATTTYWHQHPRGFANECSIMRAETAADAEELESLGYERLTVERLRKHVRWLNDENDAWGSNRAFGRISITDVMTAPDYSVANRSTY